MGMPKVAFASPPRTSQSLAQVIGACDHLILNGDTAETLHMQRREASLRLVDELLESASRAGVALTRINGNHDFDAGGIDFVELFGGAVFVTHGHAFSESILPWTAAAGAIARELVRARERNPKSMEGFLRAASEAAAVQWSDPRTYKEPSALLSIGLHPTRVAKVLAWWRRYPQDAARFADRFRPACSVIVCGHSHRGGAWQVQSIDSAASPAPAARQILNTGSFTFPSSPRAVVIDASASEISVELRAVIHRGGRYLLAPRVEASCWRIQLPQAAAR